VSGQLHAPAALPPVLIGYEVGWTLEPVWTTWREEESCPYRNSNSDPSAVQPMASRLHRIVYLTLCSAAEASLLAAVLPSQQQHRVRARPSQLLQCSAVQSKSLDVVAFIDDWFSSSIKMNKLLISRPAINWRNSCLAAPAVGWFGTSSVKCMV
jgi:hypothetical protein